MDMGVISLVRFELFIIGKGAKADDRNAGPRLTIATPAAEVHARGLATSL
jgi:hypothetical protein